MKNKSILRKSAVLLLALVMAFSFSLTSVFAEWEYSDNNVLQEKNNYSEGKEISHEILNITNDAGTTIYKGEKYYLKVRVYPLWSNALTMPIPMMFMNEVETADIEDYAGEDYLIKDTGLELPKSDGAYDVWPIYIDFDSKSRPEGNYYVAIATVPANPETLLPMSYDVDNDTRIAINSITLEKLGTPQSLKLTSGKKKVTISYSKVTGASKYEIYRSTKSSSGFSKIATTTALKYVDKKAKKGKRYYYKVRAVRQIMTSGVDLGYAKNLKAKLSNGKTTITYSKVTNATKYEIYRSTKQKSGFKKIATTTGTKYVSKTSKNYYYSVKAIGKKNLRGTAYGNYTSAKRCSKVK